MKKTYMTPEAEVIELQVESSLMNVSGTPVPGGTTSDAGEFDFDGTW